ncbi:MAG: hypothetical protein P8M65_04915 [Roseibacillus sp.]|nr:hypothetical protein [Roseibacillus sp.]
MLSALTSPTRSPSLPKPLMGSLFGVLLMCCAITASATPLVSAASSPDESLTTPGTVPEPGYSLLGACIGCVLLLHRRRNRGLMVDRLPQRGREQRIPKCSSNPNRAPFRRRNANSHRLIDTPNTGRAALRPLRAS